MTQQTPKIEKFSTVIEPYLNNGKLISYRCKYLTKPGDNYGSIILSITANIQTKSGNIEELELVAKLLPINQEIVELFQPERTFVTETKFYTILSPAIKKIQQEAGLKEDDIIDIFPKCYGARFNLLQDENDNVSEKVDQNSIIVLENLYACGYKIGDRYSGFNYEHTLVILRDLAYYHALPIALRKLKPDFFESKVKPFIQKFNLSDNVKSDLKEKLDETIKNSLRKINISENDIEKIFKLFKLSEEYNKKVQEHSDGLFITAAHCDFWVNNMLILHDINGNPVKTKLVDFQLAQYESLARDLIFFLLTSVESNVLVDNWENFLQHYYKNFVSCLKLVRCNIQEYSYKRFLDELNRVAFLEIGHVIIMLRVLFMKKDAVADVNNMDTNAFSNEDGVVEDYYEKLAIVVELFKKNEWL